MEEILKKEFGLTDNQLEKLKKFKEMLVFYNKSFNLTGITEDKEIYIKHFYDSLKGEKYFNTNSKAIEIGSGGGFPSIPLKILRDDIDFTLTDSTGKKCIFLQNVINELDLKNIRVIHNRCENLAKLNEHREKYDCVTARAVARLSTLNEYCLPFLKVGGKFIAYKSDNEEEIIESENSLKILGGKINSINNYNLIENSGKRCIIVIDKIFKTDVKYPRGQGKERSKPL